MTTAFWLSIGAAIGGMVGYYLGICHGFTAGRRQGKQEERASWVLSGVCGEEGQ